MASTKTAFPHEGAGWVWRNAFWSLVWMANVSPSAKVVDPSNFHRGFSCSQGRGPSQDLDNRPHSQLVQWAAGPGGKPQWHMDRPQEWDLNPQPSCCQCQILQHTFFITVKEKCTSSANVTFSLSDKIPFARLSKPSMLPSGSLRSLDGVRFMATAVPAGSRALQHPLPRSISPPSSQLPFNVSASDWPFFSTAADQTIKWNKRSW